MIKFGTSGWRAVIADEFTFENARQATRAICRYLRAIHQGDSAEVIVAHDTRFLGEQFARECANEVLRQNFRVVLCEQPTPTPVVSFAIRQRRAAGGITITASHNPPEYSGIKFSTADGAPALPEVTEKIEEFLNQSETHKIVSSDSESGGKIAQETLKNKFELYNPRESYLADLENKIRFDIIERAGGSYAFDPLWGTARGYLNLVLETHNLAVKTLHDWRDPLFGGSAPDPTAPGKLDELSAAVKTTNHNLGLATDGDADRFSIIDCDGQMISANQIIALLCDYLAETRGWTDKGFARSVATTHLVDRVARAWKRELIETPVGFKFIGALIDQDRIILGGEESAGLSIRNHLPEKDGILACLLVAEMVAARGTSLKEQLHALYNRVGRLESGRTDVALSEDLHQNLAEKLDREPAHIGNRKITKINRLDGVKFLFENDAWLLLRPSGTEPLVRIYAEAETKKNVKALLTAGRAYLFG